MEGGRNNIVAKIKKQPNEDKEYLQYTNYYKLPGGLKKLGFIITSILEHQAKKLKNFNSHKDYRFQNFRSRMRKRQFINSCSEFGV